MLMDRVMTMDALNRFETVIVLDENSEMRLVIYDLLMRGTKALKVVRSLDDLRHPDTPRDACVLLRLTDQSGSTDRVAGRIRAAGGVDRLVIAPCPTWFIPRLKAFRTRFPNAIFIDNYKAGDVYEQQPVLSWAEYADEARSGDFVFIPTRDPILVQHFENLIGHPRWVDLNRIEQDHLGERIKEIHALGYSAVFDATHLDATLSLVCGQTDMGRTARFAFRYLQPSHCAFDVGAHRGQLSGIFRLRCGTVHAFEPEPGPLADLQNNLRHASGVFIHGVAVSDHCGTMDFYLDQRGEFGGGSSLYSNINSSSNRISVDVVTLEKIILDTGHCPDLIKIDVEGAEPEVVFGGLDYIKEKKPIIVFELFQPVVINRANEFSNLMKFLGEYYDLTCLETDANPFDYFLTDRMPPMTNIGATPKK